MFISAWDLWSAEYSQLLAALWLRAHVSVGLIDKLGEHAVWILQKTTSKDLSMKQT